MSAETRAFGATSARFADGGPRPGLSERRTSVVLTFFLASDIVLSTPPAGLFPSAFDIAAECLQQLGVGTARVRILKVKSVNLTSSETARSLQQPSRSFPHEDCL